MKEASENACFYFMIRSFGVCIQIQYFCDVVRNKLQTKSTRVKYLISTKYLLEIIKRRSKVQEKNIPCEHALNFDQ